MAGKKKLVKFRPLYQLNIAIIVCLILLIYLAYHGISYLTGNHAAVYEVQAGTIAQDNHYQALAIRQENIVSTDRAGYPFYYAKNGSEVGVLTSVYAIDDQGGLVKAMNQTTSSSEDLPDQNLDEFEEAASDFENSYDPNNFLKTYSFESDLTNTTDQAFQMGSASNHADAIQQAAAAGTYHIYNAQTPGYLIYSTDGGEGLTVDSFTDADLDSSRYKTTDLRTTSQLAAGAPVYKQITSDDWNLILKIDSNLKKEIGDAKNIRIRFDRDQAETAAGVNFIEKNGNTYLNLSLNDSVDRYADQRMISIELLLDSESGLKIPNSSITEKRFFVIPKSYFSAGRDSDDLGFLVSGREDEGLITPTIFYADDDNYYIDSSDVKASDMIYQTNSVNKWRVGKKTAKLKGVFNVNKGYAVFNRIEIVFQNTDYTVVKSGTPYGVSLYDHIALDGSSVKEDEIIN
ncbi:MAG: HlyD family efflux transporter periplasmic adaptor subunit [Lachnospiraceae bacterium]|nr:HlyD family efflux transporter periplasmic adaptor subunit [Lachnospiraceae bacterium]